MRRGRNEPVTVEWLLAQTVPAGDCRLWMKAKQKGYGTVTVCGKSQRAHRLMYALTHDGAEPTFVRHSCDTPACIAPEHLLDGDATSNNRDTHERGRSWQSKVERCPQDHPYDEENTRITKGGRYCRACNRAAQARRRERLVSA